jgi:hypothetical protein
MVVPSFLLLHLERPDGALIIRGFRRARDPRKGDGGCDKSERENVLLHARVWPTVTRMSTPTFSGNAVPWQHSRLLTSPDHDQIAQQIAR